MQKIVSARYQTSFLRRYLMLAFLIQNCRTDGDPGTDGLQNCFRRIPPEYCMNSMHFRFGA